MSIRAYAGYSASAAVTECTNTRTQTYIMRLMCEKWYVQSNSDTVTQSSVQEMEIEIPKDRLSFYHWLVRNKTNHHGIDILLEDSNDDDFQTARKVLSMAAKKHEEIVFL